MTRLRSQDAVRRNRAAAVRSSGVPPPIAGSVGGGLCHDAVVLAGPRGATCTRVPLFTPLPPTLCREISAVLPGTLRAGPWNVERDQPRRVGRGLTPRELARRPRRWRGSTTRPAGRTPLRRPARIACVGSCEQPMNSASQSGPMVARARSRTSSAVMRPSAIDVRRAERSPSARRRCRRRRGRRSSCAFTVSW